MKSIFNVQDRQETYEFILAIAKECSKVIALCQVGSGAIGYHDACRSRNPSQLFF